MKKLIIVAGLAVMCGGCAHNVRFSLARLDARSQQQIVAMQEEKCVPFTSAADRRERAVEKDAARAAIPASAYEKLIEILPKLRWDVSVFTFEMAPVAKK